MGDQKREMLEWFINFINRNLDSLSVGDLAKLGTDFHLISVGLSPHNLEPTRWDIGEAMVEFWQSQGSLEQILKRSQNRLKQFMEETILPLNKPAPLADILDVETKEVTKMDLGRLPSPHQFFRSEVEVNFRAIPSLSPDGSAISIIRAEYKAYSPEESLLIYFAQALDGTPLHAIRRCPECLRYFIQTTKRERFFCSNKCAARKVSRERRKKLKKEKTESYTKELEGGAKRARKSYVNKVKRTHPKATVGSRPRKYKA